LRERIFGLAQRRAIRLGFGGGFSLAARDAVCGSGPGFRRGLSLGSAAICSAVVPRRRRITVPGFSNGSRVSSGSSTRSAMPRANRSWSLPQASSAAFWLGAAT
jgi:hypothetical protein